MRAFAGAACRATVSVTRVAPRLKLTPWRAVTGAASTSSAPTPDDVRRATLKWVDERVIGYNLCPFAKAPRQNDGLRLVVCEHQALDSFFETFTNEAQTLVGTYSKEDEAYDDEDDDDEAAVDDVTSKNKSNADQKPARWQLPGLSEPSTTLITVPYVEDLDDFMLFLAVVEQCEEILEEMDASRQKIQLATFHPEYQFAGEEIGDPGSYTNRSPYPTVHLLRTVDVSRAVDAHPDTEGIPDANIKKLRDAGRETLFEFVKQLREFRGKD